LRKTLDPRYTASRVSFSFLASRFSLPSFYNALSKEYLPSKTSWTTLSRSLAL
jgi:hypothetical protein